MEILIPGLILVALMAWASTKIKKRAADAYQAESIDAEGYSLRKSEGFLHVLGDANHAFYANTREFAGDEDSAQVRRATIEVDVFRDTTLANVRQSVIDAAQGVETSDEKERVSEIIAEELANQTPITAFYKIVDGSHAVYRLRFAVATEHKNEYANKIEETLDSFNVTSD